MTSDLPAGVVRNLNRGVKLAGEMLDFGLQHVFMPANVGHLPSPRFSDGLKPRLIPPIGIPVSLQK